jgi:hypothetical protein
MTYISIIRTTGGTAMTTKTISEPKFPIGHTYVTRGKHPKVCTIVDIWKTYNSMGELVRVRYVTTHEFCGKTVTDYDVVETTVAMGTKETT